MGNSAVKFYLCFIVFGLLDIKSQPSIKIDFNMAGRQDAEVNEPDYIPWVVEEGLSSSFNQDGVQFTVSKYGNAGTSLRSDWYKTIIQSPYNARLVGDGVTVLEGESGGSILLEISGLPAGEHNLLTYHNATNGREFADFSVQLNGVTVLNNIKPGNRVSTPDSAAKALISFSVSNGESVQLLFIPNLNSPAPDKNIMINALGLNVPNADKQARNPFPPDRDGHVNADDGNLTLTWTAAPGTQKHRVYFGSDSAAVAMADESSPEYQGEQSETRYDVNGLSNLKDYFWRADELDAMDITTKGNVWSFAPRHLAFPGAEGYGRFARGGRMGKVVYVSNLNDSGPGSLREAVENSIGPRTILFSVSGVIHLESRLTLKDGRITVAGQSAPGKGVAVRGAPFGFSGASDGIMRFLKIRLGAGETFDGTGLQGSDHCIFDHLSVSWTIDESFSSRSGKNITLQKTMLTEALNIADHANYDPGTKHGYAASISGDVGSFHHNLLAHNYGRSWSLAGGLDGDGNYAGRLDIFNNVVYNWGTRTTDGGAHEVNFVNNYYKPGPSSTQSWALAAEWDGFPGTQRYYCSGNIVKGIHDNPASNRNGCSSDVGNPNPWSNAPFFESFAAIHSAAGAYKAVLSDVGAFLPMQDNMDKRIIEETINGTATYSGSRSGMAGLPDHENDVGGYEEYPSVQRDANFDSDLDGLPNWWEIQMALNPNSLPGDFSDSHVDKDGNGYTNLEEYLNYMAYPQYELESGNDIQINLRDFFKGYAGALQYSVKISGCAGTNISSENLTITPNGNCPVFQIEFSARDGEGDSMTRWVSLRTSDVILNILEGKKSGIKKGALNFVDVKGRKITKDHSNISYPKLPVNLK